MIISQQIVHLPPQALHPPNIAALLRRALADPKHGYGNRKIEIVDDALAHLADVANGDARAALNVLQLAV